MITESYTVTLSIQLKSGARAEAELRIADEPMSLNHAQEVVKALRLAAATGEVVLYTSIKKTTVDDNWRPT